MTGEFETLQAENATLRRQLAAFDAATSVDADGLSKRELQIFLAIGAGRSTHDIADAMHLAASTVETYRERIKTKLQVISGQQLTRLAVLYSVRQEAGLAGHHLVGAPE